MGKNSFEEYLRCVINNQSLNDLIPVIFESFSDLTLKKNGFLVKEGEICNYFRLLQTDLAYIKNKEVLMAKLLRLLVRSHFNLSK